MKVFVSLLLLTGFLVCCRLTLLGQTADSCDDNSDFSKSGTVFIGSVHNLRLDTTDKTSSPVPSPDGKKNIQIHFVVDDEHEWLYFNLRHGSHTSKFRIEGTGAELLWAPDSKAFAVTTWDGASGFGVYTRIYRWTRQERVKEVNITPTVFNAFGHPVRCEPPMAPNTGTVEWLKDSKRILVAAQVVPVSVCDSMGMFKLYELDLSTMHVVRVYNQIAAKRDFGNLLGCSLRAAEDGCVTNPKSCYVESLHGDDPPSKNSANQ
jgi:hypothetical protein